MYTTNIFRHLLLGALVLGASQAQGQATTLGNSGAPGEYLGWDAGTLQALEVRHNGNQPIQWFTDSIQRMQLYGSQSSTINGFTGVNQNGYLGISPQPLFFSSTVGPFSRLHLADSLSNDPITYAQQFGFRPWMRNGISFTGNDDQAYIGQRYYGNDSTDLVFQWSDNPGAGNFTPDRLRFIFTSNYVAGRDTGARSMEGLEALRMYPVDSFNVNVGIGDFWKASVFQNTPVDPTERLDVLDGRVRIRQLPTELEMDTVDQFVVVNADGVLGWRNVPPGSGTGTACDWNLLNPGTIGLSTVHDVYTAVGSSTSCPDANDHVGIGTSNPSPAKLTIEETATRPSAGERALQVTMYGDDETNTGVFVRALNGTTLQSSTTIGLDVDARDGITRTVGTTTRGYLTAGITNSGDLIGMEAITSLYGTTANAIAARAALTIHSPGTAVQDGYGARVTSTNLSNADAVGYLYGVSAITTGPSTSGQRALYGKTSNCTDCWAGYFDGKVRITGDGFVNGTVQFFSDATLKMNVQELSNANELLAELEPKTYEYIPQEHPEMVLPSGPQMGFLAQEVEQVLPWLVKPLHQTAAYDSTGQMIAPAATYTTLNYIGLIPILVGAV